MIVIIARFEIFNGIKDFLVLAQIEELLILQIEIVHVTVGGIITDIEGRIEANELHQGIIHRQHTTANTRATRLDTGITLENLREALIHTRHDVEMFLSSQRSEVAPTMVCILTDDIQSVHHVFTQSSQFTQTIGLGQCLIRSSVHTGLAMITGTVTTVVTNVERLIATRSRRQLLLRRTWISQIIAGRIQAIGIYLIASGLCVKGSY